MWPIGDSIDGPSIPGLKSHDTLSFSFHSAFFQGQKLPPSSLKCNAGLQEASPYPPWEGSPPKKMMMFSRS